MKRSFQFLFVVFLFIAPLIFGMSSYHVAIVDEPNMHKDFALSASWYSSSWDYRKEITITGDSGNKTDWHILLDIPYEANFGGSYDSLRFTDNDGVSLLSYWIENSSVFAGHAYVWVKVTDPLDSSLSIFMYYGNAGASSTSSGSSTFAFYEDWTTETIRTIALWEIKSSDGSYSFDDTDAIQGSVIKVEGNAGSYKYAFASQSDWSYDYALHMRTKAESTVSSSQITQIGFANYSSGNPQALLKSYQGSDYFNVKDSEGNADLQSIDSANFDAWSIFDIRRDNTSAYLYRGEILQATASCSPDTPQGINLYCRDSEYDLYNDYLCVYKWVDGTGYSFGSEESQPVQSWHDVDQAIVIFYLPVDTWMLDMLLIIGGLCAVVLSMCAIAYWIRQGSMNIDKLFFFLILFAFGLALFLGGIAFT